MRTWLSVKDAAEYAGVSRDTIYVACQRLELRHVRLAGRRTIRTRAHWIDEWLERHARGCQATTTTPRAAGADGARS